MGYGAMDWNSIVAHIQERRTDLMREATQERLASASQKPKQRVKWRHVIHHLTDFILRREHHDEDEMHHHRELTHSHHRAEHVHHG
jgi:hypothetical protein